MTDVFWKLPFVVAILAGIIGQMLKVISFLLAEKRVNFKRFVQTDGTPNMHSTTFSALAVGVGMTAGFDSMVFAFAVCITSIIIVDTMNVKSAASQQAEAVGVLLDRVRKRGSKTASRNRGNSYTPVDVFSGVALGVVFAWFIYRWGGGH